MAKKQKSKKEQGKEKYILVRVVQFTLFEKFILKMLEKEPRADSDIAAALCLAEADVADIIEGDFLQEQNIVQGDSSRRSVAEDFSKREWLVVDSGGKEFLNPILCSKECLNYFLSLARIDPIPKAIKKWRPEKCCKFPADIDSEEIPEEIRDELKMLLKPKEPNEG